MKYRILTVLAICLLSPFILSAQKLGQWKDYFNYTRSLFVDRVDNRIYTGQSNGLFIYNLDDNSLEHLTKVNGLSDINITAIRANDDRNLLIVGYGNGNIDLVQDREITNFPDIKNSSVTGDKAIRHILVHGNEAYFSTGVGIISFDIEKIEVNDTFKVLPVGELSINETAILNDTMYAASDQGLFKASLGKDLTIFSNWVQDFSIPSPFGAVRNLAAHEGELFINMPESDPPGLYKYDTETAVWDLIRNNPYLEEVRSTAGGLVYATSYYLIVRRNDNINDDIVLTEYEGSEFDSQFSTGISDEEGNVWIADSQNGLVWRKPDGTMEFIAPEGPGTSNSFDLEFHEDRLWVASGNPSHPGTWNNNFDIRGFYKYYQGKWVNFVSEKYPMLLDDLFFDVPIAYPDRNNPDKAYVGSWFSGMLVAEGDEITALYNETNSSLGVRIEYERDDGKGYVAVGGFAQDDDDNLWITNGYADEPLSVWTAEGDWHSFAMSNELGTNTVVHKIIINRDGYKWFIRNRGGIVVFDGNDTFEDESDDRVRVLTAARGEGGLPVDEVYCLTEDLDGEIWVGCADGVAVFYSPFDVFSENPSDARQILVEQDGIFQYLLESQSVSAIAVDGANRKWIGTFGAGAFLLSEDGTEEIHRFTSENSPLPSDVINDIVIDPSSGEVFFATGEGIVSYMSDATLSSVANECNTVYPNPVREDYFGPISISGLVRDSDVKITDSRGNLVFSTTTNGGKAVWNGTNLNGERVATGVYFALISNTENETSCVSKILVIK